MRHSDDLSDSYSESPGGHATGEQSQGLLSDQPTVELVLRARQGDTTALEALLERAVPLLKRWAHGRLPPFARGSIDTGDLVQEAVLKAVQHLDTFEPKGVGAMQAYLRTAVLNRIRDEVRRVNRRGVVEELPESIDGHDPSPLEQAIAAHAYERYRAALGRLEQSRDRQLIVARLELRWSTREIADHFQFRTTAAALKATIRAIDKLANELGLSRHATR